MNFLPPVKDGSHLSLPHFPTPVHALVFRTWDMVPAARIAKVIKTDEETVFSIARSMGLGHQPDTSGWYEKGYISILKSVWHILPYEQILELLDWSEERLSYVLKEDDFLNVKLGFFKFDCPPVIYRPFTESELCGARKIRLATEKYIHPLETKPAARPFDFFGEHYPNQKSAYSSDFCGKWQLIDHTKNNECARFIDTFSQDAESLGFTFSDTSERKLSLFLDMEDCGEECHRLCVNMNSIELHAAHPVGILRAFLLLLEKLEHGSLHPCDCTRTERVKTRFIYSFCGLYSDCLDRDISISFPDGLLKSYAKCGINGVWIQGIFSKLSEYPFDKSVSEGYKHRLAKLRELTEKAARYGIKVYLYVNEPRGMPQAFFDDHPSIKGRTYHDGLACLCTSHPEVRNYLTSAVNEICENAPLLGGFFNISMSENLTHCHSREYTPTDEPCPICQNTPVEKVAADVVSILANAVHNANPNMKFFALTWAWERFFQTEQIERFISMLPKNTILMNVSENRLSFEKGGARGTVMDYTLSMPGPSKWSKQVWDIARKHGLELGAKIQINNSWECSTAPYLPVFETVVTHLDNLKNENIEHLMLSWTLGGYPSESIRIASAYFFTSTDSENSYDKILSDTYGEYADRVKAAAHHFSEAFAEFPFSIDTLYFGPQNSGCANLLYPEPTGLKSTMTCFCYDDVETWCGEYYTPETLKEQFGELCAKWKKGLEFIKDMPSCMLCDTAYYGYSLFKSSYNTLCYIECLRTSASTDFQKQIIQDELHLAMNVYKILLRSPSMGYEAANHYYVSRAMLREKIVSCAQML